MSPKKELKGMETIVKVDEVRPNDWNPNVQSPFIYEKEKTSIRKFGFVLPVIVRETDDGALEVIDGEHRLNAVKELQAEGVKIYTTPQKETLLPKGYINVKNMGKIGEETAKQLTVLMNELTGEADTLKLADLMKDLSDSVGMDHLVEIMPFTQVELENFIKLPDFDFSQFEGEPDEADGDKWVTLKYRLTQEQANIVQSAIERLVKEVPIEGKNVQARALEMIAADSLGTPIESFQ